MIDLRMRFSGTEQRERELYGLRVSLNRVMPRASSIEDFTIGDTDSSIIFIKFMLVTINLGVTFD